MQKKNMLKIFLKYLYLLLLASLYLNIIYKVLSVMNDFRIQLKLTDDRTRERETDEEKKQYKQLHCCYGF